MVRGLRQDPKASQTNPLLRPGRGWPLRFLSPCRPGAPKSPPNSFTEPRLVSRNTGSLWSWLVGLAMASPCSRVKVRVSQSSFRLSQLCRESSSRPSRLAQLASRYLPTPFLWHWTAPAVRPWPPGRWTGRWTDSSWESSTSSLEGSQEQAGEVCGPGPLDCQKLALSGQRRDSLTPANRRLLRFPFSPGTKLLSFMHTMRLKSAISPHQDFASKVIVAPEGPFHSQEAVGKAIYTGSKK